MITISIYIYIYIYREREREREREIKINLKMSIGVWSTLPVCVFLPIHLHSSLQCHAQLAYPFTFTKLHVHSQNYFPKNKRALIYWCVQVHLHADLVYIYICDSLLICVFFSNSISNYW